MVEACLLSDADPTRAQPVVEAPMVSFPFTEPGLTLCTGQGWPKERRTTMREERRKTLGSMGTSLSLRSRL